MPKVILITNNDLSGILFVNYLIRNNVDVERLYLVSSIRGSFSEKIKRAWSLVAKKSILFVLYKFFVEKMAAQYLLVDNINVFSLKRLALKKNIPLIKINDVNDPKFISEFAEFKNSEKVVLSAYGSQIFSESLIEKIKYFWNIHGALLPYFRGAAPYFWMLINPDMPCGVTLHKVDNIVDRGAVLSQKEINPRQDDSLLLYHSRCILGAGEMTVRFINELSSGSQNKDDVLLKYAKKGIILKEEYKIVSKYFGLPNKENMLQFKLIKKKLFNSKDFNQIQSDLMTHI